MLVQEKRNSSALSMELRLSNTNLSKSLARHQLQLLWRCVHRCTFRAQIVCPVERRGITAEDEAHIPVTAKMRPDWSRTC